MLRLLWGKRGSTYSDVVTVLEAASIPLVQTEGS